MSSETWWCRCIALSDATSRIRKFSKFCVHVKLAEVDQTFTAKDLGRGVIDTCSTGSISGTGTGTGIYIDLYRIPVLYRYNTCRNSENAFRIPTLIQRNLFQITNVANDAREDQAGCETNTRGPCMVAGWNRGECGVRILATTKYRYYV